MYELVIENNGVESVTFSAERKREVELAAQLHVRSLADGFAMVREVKDKEKEKK
ncbi:hypothetical protein [Pseudodesulfovibrio sp. JC047]|uniref:hypothetical protein n=1 Tax=Pseudodesulfovibrio sp. JC047 TaxID=2683199 RepID=UPI00193EE387|nr:hypothetical protein [Pseudodesulfovibrio sp. JC047]